MKYQLCLFLLLFVSIGLFGQNGNYKKVGEEILQKHESPHPYTATNEIISDLGSNLPSNAIGSDCQPNLTLSGTINDGLYEVENTITSTGTIGTNQSVIYHAGNNICLNEVFLADASNGSVFLAEIEDCGSGFTSGPVNSLTQEPTDVIYDYGNTQMETSKQMTTDASSSFSVKNFPNPFTGQTTMEFDLSEDTEVTLFVSDLNGKQIARLLDGKPTLKGTHQVVFDGKAYPAGMYYYTVQAGQYIVTQKMTLIK